MVKGSVLVAPLNWGLGHATRCIPLIKSLQQEGYTPVIASDGIALELLIKEFPKLKAYEFKDLNITYAKRGFWFNYKILLQLSKLVKSIRQEQKVLKHIIEKENLIGIIADNRLGLFHKKIPCAIISHQLNVLSGNTTWLSSKMHRHYLKKYDECWVPDNRDEPTLSGKLGHLKNENFDILYLGILSRFKKIKLDMLYDVLIVLSGPEPQRTLLEKIILNEFKDYQGKVVLVRGKVEDVQKKEKIDHITVYNFMKAKGLETLIQQSKVIVARSGYTTLMDLAKLDKKAFLIPTPGQSEQQYLAKRLEKMGIAPYCKQEDFNLNQLKRIATFKGLGSLYRNNTITASSVFRLFNRK